jgi:hypothetical protein
LLFDNLSEEAKKLIDKQDDDPKHQVLGYLAVPFAP